MTKIKFLAVSIILVFLAAGLAWHKARLASPAEKPAPATDRAKILYWYDPMHPEQHFDKPGKSPYMDMELVPRLAGEGQADASVQISPSMVQNLGVRLAKTERIALSSRVEASGLIGFDERNVAIVQSRANGFVEKVPPLAPGDVVHQGDALAILSVPEWTAAANEFLAALESNDSSLADAARDRLRLSGIPQANIRELEKSRKASLEFVLRAPVSGVIQSLDTRLGMNVSPGQTLARINGLSTVWLDAAVPQSISGEIHVGDEARARIAGLGERMVSGKVQAVLPVLDDASRSLKVRIALPNPELELRPGTAAQVRIGHVTSETALAVPTEAVIRTGKRSLVMVSEGKGKFVPVEVTLGQEIGDKTVIVSGLEENQDVASSGQFLIDSEASLSGVMARAPDARFSSQTSAESGETDEADATVVALPGGEVTLQHGPFRAFNMPGMTMTFPLAAPDLAQGLKPGDMVHVVVRKTSDGLVVAKIGKMEKMGGMGGKP